MHNYTVEFELKTFRQSLVTQRVELWVPFTTVIRAESEFQALIYAGVYLGFVEEIRNAESFLGRVRRISVSWQSDELEASDTAGKAPQCLASMAQQSET